MNNQEQGTRRISLSEDSAAAPLFPEVFKQYYAALCDYADRTINHAAEAEDIVSGVFMQLWNRHEPFRNERHLQAWLYKSTRNAALNHLKQRAHAGERQLLFLHESEHFGKSETEELIYSEVIRRIYLEIKGLPEQWGRIVSMSYLDGKKNEEIAEELGLSVQTVKNQKSQALSRLRLRLSGEMFAILLLLSSRH
jgi:RNA polymerase sigma-70 factor (ECF subfamily)